MRIAIYVYTIVFAGLHQHKIINSSIFEILIPFFILVLFDLFRSVRDFIQFYKEQKIIKKADDLKQKWREDKARKANIEFNKRVKK